MPDSSLNYEPLTPAARQGNTGFAVSVSLLLLRLALGTVFIYHGSGKLFNAFDGPGMEAWTNFIASQHLPLLPPVAWAYLSASGEFFGGVSILLGLLARLGSLPVIATMIVAILTVTGSHGFSSQHGGYEYNVVLIALAATILIAGPGLISLDAFLFPRSLYARGPQPLDNPAKRES